MLFRLLLFHSQKHYFGEAEMRVALAAVKVSFLIFIKMRKAMTLTLEQLKDVPVAV